MREVLEDNHHSYVFVELNMEKKAFFQAFFHFFQLSFHFGKKKHWKTTKGRFLSSLPILSLPVSPHCEH